MVRVFTIIGWDGCLPLIPPAAQVVLSWFVNRDLSQLIPLLIVLPAVAIARTYYANQQLARLGGRPTFDRKILLAAAIIAMLLFEGILIPLLSDPTVPLAVWGIELAIYLAYLAFIFTALRPLTTNDAGAL